MSGIYDFETHTDRAQVPFILTSTGQRERFWFWREKEDTGFANVTFNFKRLFATPGHELNLNAQYARLGRRGVLPERGITGPRRERQHACRRHREHRAGDTRLRASTARRTPRGGHQAQRRWLPVTYTVGRGVRSVIYEGLGDSSDWDENIYAAYANLVRVQSRYSLEAGMRAEHTEVTYSVAPENVYYDHNDRYDYFELFPNAKLTYRLSQANRLIAAYNRRVDRPTEADLRIFPVYDDPELLNPSPAAVHPRAGAGFAWSWAAGSATASLTTAISPTRIPDLRH